MNGGLIFSEAYGCAAVVCFIVLCFISPNKPTTLLGWFLLFLLAPFVLAITVCTYLLACCVAAPSSTTTNKQDEDLDKF
jgi:hypothetical protein